MCSCSSATGSGRRPRAPAPASSASGRTGICRPGRTRRSRSSATGSTSTAGSPTRGTSSATSRTATSGRPRATRPGGRSSSRSRTTRACPSARSWPRGGRGGHRDHRRRRAVVGGVLFPNGCQVSAPKASGGGRRALRRAGRPPRRAPPGRADRGRAGPGNRRRDAARPGRHRDRVLAAGAWTNALLASSSGPGPRWSHLSSLASSPSRLGVPPTMPTLMLQEFSFIWLREENGGLLWGSSYEEAPRLAFLDAVPPTASTTCRSTGSSRSSATVSRPRRRFPCWRATGA